MLQIENASIAYGNDILFSGFNLQLERGEIASISGPSGCGKSSLLNAILGFTPLKEGRIVLNGILLDKGNVDVVRKQTAWIPQELALPLEWVKDMVNEISGGQRQRMMIAVASMIGKPLTIVDEPTSALDSGSAEKVLSFFRRQTENGSAILTVSHDKRFANGCDRHIIMK